MTDSTGPNGPDGVIWCNHESIRPAATIKSCPDIRLSRVVRQQRAGARECLGLPVGVWPGFEREPGAGNHPQSPGDFSKPATGQSAVERVGTESLPIRTGLWSAESGTARPGLSSGAGELGTWAISKAGFERARLQ